MSATLHGERGHTLLELVVAATLVAVLGVVIGLIGRYTSGETLHLRRRARTAGELHAAVEYLRKDLARAARVERHGRAGLRIFLERPMDGIEPAAAWAADARITYDRDDEGRLLRSERHQGESLVVAQDIRSFKPERREEGDLAIEVVAGADNVERRVTLIWVPR